MKKLLSLITICMITTLCISINSSAATFGDNLTYDKVSNAEIATKALDFETESSSATSSTVIKFFSMFFPPVLYFLNIFV